MRQAGRKVPEVPPGNTDGSLEAFPVTSTMSDPVSAVERHAPATSPAAVHTSAIPSAPTGVAERLITHPNADTVVVEQYRKLAAILHQAQVERAVKVVMLASAQTAEGKTLTAVNLALTLSESYRRTVLLVDADLRRPSLHEIFRVPNVSGLNEGLKASADEPLAALKITETLTLLPAGRPEPDPMGGLSSPRMGHILQEGAARFDWVIIDTAPIGLLADAHLLATTVDGALLVVRANQTPYAEVAKALEALGRERVFGVILNGAQAGPVSSYSRYAPEVPGPPAPGTPGAAR
jgi:receptor protein-tyrosine kinase